MRKITHIVIHCTGASQRQTVDSVRAHWRRLGWKSPGYHWIIPPDGEAVRLSDDEDPTNGVRGHNANSIHLCYIGGVDAKGTPQDNRTDAQKKELEELVRFYHSQHPKAKILGHRDFANVAKACPSFSVADWLKEIDLT